MADLTKDEARQQVVLLVSQFAPAYRLSGAECERIADAVLAAHPEVLAAAKGGGVRTYRRTFNGVMYEATVIETWREVDGEGE